MKTKQLTSSNRSHNTYNTDAACTVAVLLLLRYRMIKGRLKSKSTFIPAPLNTCLVEKHSNFIHPAGFPRRHHTPLCRNRGNSPATKREFSEHKAEMQLSAFVGVITIKLRFMVVNGC
jgi:hypothetical protein